MGQDAQIRNMWKIWSGYCASTQDPRDLVPYTIAAQILLSDCVERLEFL